METTKTDMAEIAAAYGVDLDYLRAKYAEERDKRLKPVQNEQFVEVTGDFSHYVDDPYIDEPLVRDPVLKDVDAVVVGGGFGGLQAAAHLTKAGIDDFLMIEKAGDFGGTWYWNRYPGAQCDIEAYIYMPLLEETGHMPTLKYVYAEELFAHSQRIGRHFDLYRRALFQTQIREFRWDESAHRWIVTTDRGDVIRSRFVLSCCGPLNRPKLPGIPGIGDFKGHTFHTSRWDYGYTGGNSKGGLTGLADKRVAVIGTGATAIQCVPYIAQDAGHLYVVQRTPSTVGDRGNRPTDAEWFKTLKPGWQRERMDNFIETLEGRNTGEDLVDDGWTQLFHDTVTALRNPDGSPVAHDALDQMKEIADFRKANELRQRVEETVRDKDTAERLKAWYYLFCKRPLFNDEYLPAFNRPNVSLIDTEGRGPDRITENAIVFDGVEYPVDCIIFATGFEVGTSYARRASFEIVGSDGVTLSEKFADGTRTLHGVMTHGFPNFFIMALGQNGFKPNFTDQLDELAGHILAIIKKAQVEAKTRIEVSADAENAWATEIMALSRQYKSFLAACTPGYYSGEGDVNKGFLADTYAPGAGEFTKVLSKWRNEAMPGVAFS